MCTWILMVRLMQKRETNLPTIEWLWSTYDYSYLNGKLISRATGKPIQPTRKGRNFYFTLSWRLNGIRNYYRTTVGRIVFAWITGSWPSSDVDHINRDTTDNRFSNLRTVTTRVNCLNRSSFKGGVTQQASGNWRVRIRIDGKQQSLGTYNTREEAMQVYANAFNLAENS